MKRGFTLIEVVIAAGIIIILSAFLLSNLFSDSKEAQLNSTTQQLVASVRTVQGQAATQAQGSVWGIHFANATNTTPFYAIFSGSSYTTSGTVATYPLPASLGFTTSTLAAGATEDIIFSAVSGAASASTTVGVYVLAEPSLSSTISISNIGSVIAKTPSTPSSPTAVNPVLGAWQVTTPIAQYASVISYAAALYNNYIYAIGGSDNNTGYNTSTVLYSQIQSNGAPTSWQNTTALPTDLSGLQAITYNGYLYYLNGQGDYPAAPTSTIFYSQIQSNGTLGSWQTATGRSVAGNGVVAYNGYLYSIGGATVISVPLAEDLPTTTVSYAQIQSNGSLGSWSNLTALPAPLSGNPAVISNGYIYELGGAYDENGDATATVYYAQIQSNGTLGSWQSATPLPAAFTEFSANAYNGYLYEVGGAYSYVSGGTTYGYNTSTVSYAQVQSNGSLGSWQLTTSLPFIVYDQSTIAYNGNLYEMGGLTGYGYSTSTILYSSL